MKASGQEEPVVTAEKYIRYKIENGHIRNFTAPEIVLVCYQQSTLRYFQEKKLPLLESPSFSNLYLFEKKRAGILAGWGMGAPALANKVEQLIALGVKKFIAVGIAGSLMDRHQVGEFVLCTHALAEDGVSQHYLHGQDNAPSSPEMITAWKAYAEQKRLPSFHEAGSWSFSAIFKESPSHIRRVVKKGYDVVEMEAASLHAICMEKGAQALSLFVVSDTLTTENWTPHLKEAIVKDHLHELADWALDFCLCV